MRHWVVTTNVVYRRAIKTRLEPILAVLVLVLVSMAMPVYGQMQGAVGDWGDQYRHNLGKPEYGWLEEGFGPCAIYPGYIKFVTSYRWDDYEYMVPVREVAAALDAGLFEPSPGYKTMADIRAGDVRAYLNRYNQLGGEWIYFEGADPPTTVSGWNSMGVALYERGRYEEALQAFDEAIQLNPDLAVVWHNNGTAFRNLGRYEEALQAFDEAIRLDPEYVDAWTMRGLTLADLSNYDEAIQSYDEAIRLDPKHSGAWYGKSMALRILGRIPEADAAYARSEELQLYSD